MNLHIYRLLERTGMAGPGMRFCLWVQGCNHRCKGCMAEETWSFDHGTTMDTDLLFQQFSTMAGIEGVTFLGGEPFEQAEAVGTLAELAQSVGLSVVTFTGFTYEKLLALNYPSIQRLLKASDLLIDGPFIQEQFDLSRPWVGSTNQRFHLLSNRYNENDFIGIQNQIEIRIASNGKTLVNGMGDFSKIKTLL